ncbi:MAG: DNA-directed polymerase subunit sigma [Paenibacillus sp.]|nr:DNA-directed polymerase subunit sigma [Paenibacillus sp.]
MLQWIEAARLGDRESFGLIVRRFTPMAYAVAYERLRDSHLAEDAVQEAFTEAFLHIDKLRDPEAFPGWFKAIVVRQCHRLLRRKRHWTLPLDEIAQIAGVQASLSDIVERKELQRLLHTAIASLSANMRVAVQLFYFYGYTLQEISHTLGTPIPVLKKRLFDARRKLKGTLPIADCISVFHHLYEGGSSMLHIVNGDSVGDKLKQGVVQGDILVWREVYPAGPVFADMAEPDNRSARALYLEQSMGIPRSDYIRISETQERQIREFRQYKEIVLWFEHDLFDQTMLCYLLHWFSKQQLGGTKLSLLCIGEFPGIERFRGLGQLSVQQMETLSGTWQTIGQLELDLGRELWEAYASPDPMKLMSLLQGDTSALPFVRQAFEAHLARLPSVDSGLGLVERTTLEKVRSGISSPVKLFQHVGDELHICCTSKDSPASPASAIPSRPSATASLRCRHRAGAFWTAKRIGSPCKASTSGTAAYICKGIPHRGGGMRRASAWSRCSRDRHRSSVSLSVPLPPFQHSAVLRSDCGDGRLGVNDLAQ